MALGIQVKNDAGHLIISSDVPSFHYLGRATKVNSFNNYMSDFPNYGDATGTLSGSWTHEYEIIAENQSDILVYIRPGINYTTHYGVLRKRKSTITQRPAPGGPVIPPVTTWKITIVQHGPSQRPPQEVLCFHQLEGVTEPAKPYGFATFLANKQVAFDPERQPMFLKGTIRGIPPRFPFDDQYYPCYSASCEEYYDLVYSLNHDFKSETRKNFYSMSNIKLTTDDSAFSAPSIGQSVWNHAKHGWTTDTFLGVQYRFRTRYANWWVMYVQTWGYAWKATASNPWQKHFVSRWTPFRANFFQLSTKDSGLKVPYVFSWTISSSTDTSGSQPYTAKTINREYNTCMFIKPSDYI